MGKCARYARIQCLTVCSVSEDHIVPNVLPALLTLLTEPVALLVPGSQTVQLVLYTINAILV